MFAATGTVSAFDAMIEWYKGGHKAEEVPSFKSTDERMTLIVFANGRCFTYSTGDPYPDECFAPDAWGSGYQYAIGSMKRDAALGFQMDARSAVSVAMDCDVDTGGEIFSESLVVE